MGYTTRNPNSGKIYRHGMYAYILCNMKIVEWREVPPIDKALDRFDPTWGVHNV